MRRRSLFILFGLLVVLVLLTNLRLPFTNRLKNILSEGFIPFLEFSSRIQSRSVFLINRVKAYKDLQLENTELTKQIVEFSARVVQVEELEHENREFRKMLDFKERTELKLISAKIIGRDPSNWFNTVLIDRGSSDGITINMPVLTVEGLVGKTIEVARNNSRVILILDENCKVSGWLRDSRQYGIVQGDLLAGGTGSQCRMSFIDRSAQLKNNDKVYTSGLADISGLGIFPKGILIGTVVSIVSPTESNKNNLYQEVKISPAVDLRSIDDVFVGVELKPQSKARQKTEVRSKESE